MGGGVLQAGKGAALAVGCCRCALVCGVLAVAVGAGVGGLLSASGRGGLNRCQTVTGSIRCGAGQKKQRPGRRRVVRRLSWPFGCRCVRRGFAVCWAVLQAVRRRAVLPFAGGVRFFT